MPSLARTPVSCTGCAAHIVREIAVHIAACLAPFRARGASLLHSWHGFIPDETREDIQLADRLHFLLLGSRGFRSDGFSAHTALHPSAFTLVEYSSCQQNILWPALAVLHALPVMCGLPSRCFTHCLLCTHGACVLDAMAGTCGASSHNAPRSLFDTCCAALRRFFGARVPHGVFAPVRSAVTFLHRAGGAGARP